MSQREEPLEKKEKTWGQIAYEAYCGAVGWKSVMGVTLPKWQQQRESLKDAWETAAQAVLTGQKDYGDRTR